MESQGFRRFAVVGHDRGARVAYRLALDHPSCVTALAVLDIVPTASAFAAADMAMMLGFWPWSLLAQPAPLPERLIRADPDAFVDHALAHWGTPAEAFPPAFRDEYVRALRDPRSAHAICEEFRAAATLDVAHDRKKIWRPDGP